MAGPTSVNGPVLITAENGGPAVVPQLTLGGDFTITGNLQIGMGTQHINLVTGSANLNVTGTFTILGDSYFTATSGTWQIGDAWSNASSSTAFSWGAVTLRLSAPSANTTIDNGPTANNADFPNTVFEAGNSFSITGNNLEFLPTSTVQVDAPIARTTNIIHGDALNQIAQNAAIDNAPSVTNGQIEGQSGNVAVPVSTPTFSWVFNDVDSPGSADIQGAYRLCISSVAIDDSFSSCDHFDSGKVASNAGNYIYAGPALVDETVYHWRVMVYDQLNTVSVPFADQTFKVSQPALQVADGVAKPAAQKIFSSPNGVVVHHFQISEFGADPNNARINEIVFNATGTAAISAISNARIYADDGTTANVFDGGDTQVGLIASPASNILTFDVSAAAIDIADSSSQTFWLVIDQANTADFDDTYSFQFVSVSGVQNTFGVSASAGSASQSNTFTIGWGSVALADSGSTYPENTDPLGDGQESTVLRFSLTESSNQEAATVNTVVISNSGTALENNDIQEARLYEEGNGTAIATVASGSITADNQNITFTTAIVLVAGQTKNFFVKYVANVDGGSTGGSSFIANISGASLGATNANSGGHGRAPVLTGNNSGRTIILAKPEVSLNQINLSAAQQLFVVEAPTAERVAYVLDISESSGTSTATINSVTFDEPVKVGSWGANDLNNLILSGGGKELALYVDSNSNGSYDAGIDAMAFGPGTEHDLATAMGAFTFSGASFTVAAGQTKRLFLVARVEADPNIFYEPALPIASKNFKLRFDLSACPANCVNAVVGGNAAASDANPAITGTNMGTEMYFERGLVDGALISDDDTSAPIQSGGESKILKFAITNVTPGSVATQMNGLTFAVTPNSNNTVEKVILRNSNDVVLASTTNPAGGSLSFSGIDFNPGESKTFSLAVKLTPQANPGTALSMQVNDVSGTLAVNNGFPIIQTQTVARALETNLEVRRNYPDFNNGEYALITFKTPADQQASIKIYALSGELVKDFGTKSFSSDTGQVFWYGETDKGRRVGFGVYFVYVVTSEYQVHKKVFVRKRR